MQTIPHLVATFAKYQFQQGRQITRRGFICSRIAQMTSTPVLNGTQGKTEPKTEPETEVISDVFVKEEKQEVTSVETKKEAPESTSLGTNRYKIYTKTGDKGTSSLYSGERRPKDDEVFQALGDVDELNSGLGLAHEFCRQEKLEDICLQIEEIQSRLLDVGSAVATPLDSSAARKVSKVKFDPTAVIKLEQWIDQMDTMLPPLTNFILPSGGLASSQIHVSRSLCRRAERRVVPLVTSHTVHSEVGVYLNRLSDYLFTAARIAAQRGGHREVVYKKVMASSS